MTSSVSPTPEPPDCPDHKPVQHRDGNPPWCKRCGWTSAKAAVPARPVAPVPSPTPDEPAAEKPKWADLFGIDPTFPDESSGGQFARLEAERDDLRAALVVARERLAAVEALCDENDRDAGATLGIRVNNSRIDTSAVRAALVGRPPTPHPTQEKP